MKTLPRGKGQAYLISDRLTRFYISGTDIAEGYILYTKKPSYFTDARYFHAAKDKIAAAGLTPVLLHGISDISSAIKEEGVTELLVDYSRVTVKEFFEYKTFANTISDCSEILESAREVKTEEELSEIKKACEVAQNALTFALDNVKAGMTEKELCKILEDKMKELGAEGPSFETIVAFGENAAVPHHVTGDTELKENTAILIDTGAKVGFYLSDVTRMAFFGKPDDKFLNAYSAVLAANEKAEREIVAGMDTFSADKIARDVLSERGLGEYFTHSLGHGVGMEIHETPYLAPKKAPRELKENVVFTVEPGVYLNGEFGIRIEDTCVIKGGKTQRLFTDSKELKIIPIK